MEEAQECTEVCSETLALTTKDIVIEASTDEQSSYEDPDAAIQVSIPEAVRNENPLQLFVALLTVKLLKECQALQNRTHEQWVAHSKRLIVQTLEDLTLTEGFCPENTGVKRLCRSVMKELQKKFCIKGRLDFLILLQHPAVDAVIVQCLRAHVSDESARLADHAAHPPSYWKYVLVILIAVGTVITAVVLIIAYFAGLLK